MNIEHIALHEAQSFFGRNRADAQHVALPTKGYFFGIKEGGELAAIMGLQKLGNIMRIKTLLTRRVSRKKGYCSALVDFAIANYPGEYSVFCTENSAGIMRKKGFVDQREAKNGIVFMKRPA